MKKHIGLLGTLFLFLGMLWQCSDKNETSTLDLKSSINYRVNLVNKAISNIQKTSGYQIITLQEDNSLKSLSTETFTKGDSIMLSDIKGVYEYQPANFKKWCFFCYDQLFKKTADSSILVVKMPQEKIFYPYRFNHMQPADSVLANNFEIAAHDYHFYFSNGSVFDYKLSAGFKLDNMSIGTLDIESYKDLQHVSKYAANYVFENNYGVSVQFISGDTSMSSFALTDASGVLLKESVKRMKVEGNRHREKEYTLTIGNIDIIRASGSDSLTIYVGGVLQQNAIVTVIEDSTDTDHSICKKRDIKITFDDNTSVVLSELIGPSLSALKELVGSMSNMYFASHMVDYIAWNIYRNKNKT